MQEGRAAARPQRLTGKCPLLGPWPSSPVVLTRPLDRDLELSAAGALGEHLEVCSFLHTHALRLQAPSRGPTGIGVTGWEKRGEVGGSEGPWKDQPS